MKVKPPPWARKAVIIPGEAVSALINPKGQFAVRYGMPMVLFVGQPAKMRAGKRKGATTA